MDLVQRLVPDELWELFQRVVDTYVYFHGVVDGDWGMSTAAGLLCAMWARTSASVVTSPPRKPQWPPCEVRGRSR